MYIHNPYTQRWRLLQLNSGGEGGGGGGRGDQGLLLSPVVIQCNRAKSFTSSSTKGDEIAENPEAINENDPANVGGFTSASDVQGGSKSKQHSLTKIVSDNNYPNDKNDNNEFRGMGALRQVLAVSWLADHSLALLTVRRVAHSSISTSSSHSGGKEEENSGIEERVGEEEVTCLEFVVRSRKSASSGPVSVRSVHRVLSLPAWRQKWRGNHNPSGTDILSSSLSYLDYSYCPTAIETTPCPSSSAEYGEGGIISSPWSSPRSHIVVTGDNKGRYLAFQVTAIFPTINLNSLSGHNKTGTSSSSSSNLVSINELQSDPMDDYSTHINSTTFPSFNNEMNSVVLDYHVQCLWYLECNGSSLRQNPTSHMKSISPVYYSPNQSAIQDRLFLPITSFKPVIVGYSKEYSQDMTEFKTGFCDNSLLQLNLLVLDHHGKVMLIKPNGYDSTEIQYSLVDKGPYQQVSIPFLFDVIIIFLFFTVRIVNKIYYF